jgi:transposase
MTRDTPPPTHFIGCDVGKTHVVVFDSRNHRISTLPNDAKHLAAFAATLDDTCLVICEATGGYETGLLTAIVTAARAVHRADARKVKAFIRSFGILGKTDKIDARALARYGQERHTQLALWQPPDAQRDALQAMVRTRRDLVDQRVSFSNRLAAPGAHAVQRCLKGLLTALNRAIDAIDKDIAALIKAHTPLAEAIAVLRQNKGIGFLTATSLVALLPELGTANRRQVASLAGLAPHPSQSGASDAYRHTRGGRPEIKKILFMAALTAVKHDPKMKAFYERLLANGKKKLVALTAVMRKIIVICNAILRPIAKRAPVPNTCCG